MAGSVLRDRTLYLVRNRPITLTYKKIGEATTLEPRWIEAFAAGRVDDPGVCKVELLYNYLAAEPLALAGPRA